MSLTGNILITGGSGTLGQAIVRAALKEGWGCAFTIYSRSELRQAEMRARYPRCRYVLGDVRDYDRLAAAVAGHDLVIHAAAMKRIPECEAQPGECYATNVIGSQHVVRACIAAGVARCVGVSTDKACRAVTAYGASKLAMEKLFQSQSASPVIFTLVRYGNVLASNGSVIPLWREQSARGQALTITDRRCTRFWMTERDAVRMVRWATMCAAGEIAVPAMSALNIADMAQIIAPGCDTTEMGLRACEKLHEDLIHPDEVAAQTLMGDFVVGRGKATGHRYTSEIAPRLTKEQFLAMLREADDA